MPTDPTTYVGAAIGLLGLAGGAVAWFIRRRDAKADPIPKQAAAVALAEKSVSMMQTVAVRVDTEIAEVKVELQANKVRMQTLQDSLESLDEALTAAVGYIVQLHRYLRQGAHGAEPAIPEPIRSLIDHRLRHADE
jgi:hypothetical protein